MKKFLFAVIAFVCLSQNVMAQQEEMPDTTDLNGMLSIIKELPDGEQKWNLYVWLYNKMDEQQPQDYELCAMVTCNMAIMQMQAGSSDVAEELYQEALINISKYEEQDPVEALFLDAVTRINRSNMLQDQKDYQAALADQARAIDELFSYMKKADPNDEDVQENLEDIDLSLAMVHIMMALNYEHMEMYDKVLEVGKKAIDLWEQIKDADVKNGTLYYRYITCDVVCRAAAKMGQKDVFHTYAKDMETFLCDVAEKYKAKAIAIDDNTSKILSSMCGMLLESYSYVKEYQRCEELACMGVLFSPESTAEINYDLCKAMVANGRSKDALKLYRELVSNKEFVERYELTLSDPVGEQLAQLLDSEEVVAVNVSAPAGGVENLSISGLTSALDRSLKGSQPARFQIVGYDITEIAPRVSKNGRITFPIDKQQRRVVGVSFSWGR